MVTRRCASSSSARRSSPCRRSKRCSRRATRRAASSRSPIGRAAAASRSATRRSRRVALDHGLPVFQPERLRAAGRRRRRSRPGSPTSASSPPTARSFPSRCSRVPRLGMINVHASLLPRYRGAAPVHRAVIDGDAETGVTIMRVVKALDAGRDAREGHAADRPTRPATSSSATSRRSAPPLLVSVVDQIASGTAHRRAAGRHARATYAARLTKEEGLIDWTQPAPAIHNRVRGLYPWPHAYTYLDGRRLIVLRTRSRDEPSTTPRRARFVTARLERSRRRDRPRPADHRRAAARRPAADAGAGLPRRPSVRLERVHSATASQSASLDVVIAPARTAAFRALQAIEAGRVDLPDGAGAEPRALADERDRALAAEIVTGTLRWQRALDHLIVAHRQPRRSSARSGSRRHPAPQPVSDSSTSTRVPASAVVDDAVDLAQGGAQAERGRVRQRRAADDPARSDTGCRCRRGPSDGADRGGGARRTSASRSRIPTGSSTRWLDRYGFDAAERWVEFNNDDAGADAARQPAARPRATRSQPHCSLDDVETSRRRLCARRAGRDRGQPAAGRARRHASSSRTKRRSSCRWPSAPDPANACSTSAPRRAARRRRWRRDMSDRGTVVACDVRPRRIAPAARHRRRAAARPSIRIVQVPRQRTAAVQRPCSIACSSMRPARASAPCGATRTSAGGGSRTTCRLWPRLRWSCWRAPPPSSAGRPPGLCHLLERARRERGRGRRVSRGARRLHGRSTWRGEADLLRSRPSSMRTGCCGTLPFGTGSRPSSPRRCHAIRR